MSIEPFNKLVKLVARAFYDDITTKGYNQPKSGTGRRTDNKGIAVVVLDALTRRQWVREEDLAKDLKLQLNQLRRTLRFFEQEKLVTRDHRKETVKGAKAYNNLPGKDGENKTHSYCSLDYAQIHDVVRYRLHRMKKKLKHESDNTNTAPDYVCPKCGKRYNGLDANGLVSSEDASLRCESCNTELVAEVDNGSEKVWDLLQKMEVELKSLMDQLARVKDLEAPDYGTLQAWEEVVRAANGDSNANDSSRSGQGGTPMPFVGETKVEVSFSSVEEEEKGEIKSENAPVKVLPPWMIKEGMNLTQEQCVAVKQESKIEGTSATVGLKDEKSINQEDGAKNTQDEYLKAYYAALLQRQKEQEEATKREQELSSTTNSTDVHASYLIKRQRDHDEEGEGDIEWEDTSIADAGEVQSKEKMKSYLSRLKLPVRFPARNRSKGFLVKGEIKGLLRL